MKVFISGASGLVGNNCQRYFTQMNWQVLGTYFSYPTPETCYFNTLDIEDQKNVDILAFQPDVIVHCGALTHVDYCESHEQESYQKTVQSTKNLLSLCQQTGARMVYISTDYVFDGKEGPYTEDAPVNPLSVYARHKLEGEQMTLAASEENLVLRVTNVYGREARNKNFVSRIIDQCNQQQEMTFRLPIDQYATPVNAWDIARAMYLLLRDAHQGVFHIAGTDWMNRVELALHVLRFFPDAKYQLQALETIELKQGALRPLRGGLLRHRFTRLYPEFIFGTVDQFVEDSLRP